MEKLIPSVPCRTLTGEIRKVPLEAMSFRPAGYGLIFHADKILLLRNRHTGKYIFPGGSVHIGERLEAAVIREVQEETGLIVTAESLVHVADYCFYDAPSDEAWHCLRFFIIVLFRVVYFKRMPAVTTRTQNPLVGWPCRPLPLMISNPT